MAEKTFLLGVDEQDDEIWFKHHEGRSDSIFSCYQEGVFECDFDVYQAISLMNFLQSWVDHKLVQSGRNPLFELRTSICPKCGKRMMKRLPAECFPMPFDMNQDYQMQRQGIVYESDFWVGEGNTPWLNICVDCKDIETKTFVCYICHEHRVNRDMKVQTRGQGLCVQCYKSVSAEAWDDAKEAIDRDYCKRLELEG